MYVSISLLYTHTYTQRMAILWPHIVKGFFFCSNHPLLFSAYSVHDRFLTQRGGEKKSKKQQQVYMLSHNHYICKSSHNTITVFFLKKKKYLNVDRILYVLLPISIFFFFFRVVGIRGRYSSSCFVFHSFTPLICFFFFL